MIYFAKLPSAAGLNLSASCLKDVVPGVQGGKHRNKHSCQNLDRQRLFIVVCQKFNLLQELKVECHNSLYLFLLLTDSSQFNYVYLERTSGKWTSYGCFATFWA